VNELLAITLEAAVPLRIHEIRGWSTEERIARARECAPVLASHGDDLQFGGKRTQEAFAALVTGLACLAYQPGGVRFMGRTWCAAPAEYVVDGRALCGPCATLHGGRVSPEPVDGDGSTSCAGR
jgi:hypothetical protein